MDLMRDGDLRQIGPYRLIRELGSGGMGHVYLGRSRGGRAVAVKVVHRELAGDSEFRRRFAAEVAAARQVGGFYTAQVVDADTSADPPWLATAYIPGPSLAEAVGTHGPLPPPAVRLLGAGLAEGLSAIHAYGLVHRDLTHRNVILADDGPRVIDFGIAKALDTVHLSTSVIGTPGFMSPEQATGGRAGPESDVFSLGCVLAYAARGTGPFGGGRPDLVVYRVVHQEPDLAGVPDDLVPLLRSCLAKNPAERPALDDVLDHLAPHVDGFTTAAWLPPDVTAMIAERGAMMREAIRSDPQPPGRTRVEPGGAVAGGVTADRPYAGAGAFRPQRAAPAPDPGHRRRQTADRTEPVREPSAAGGTHPAPDHRAAGIARAATALALLCLPGLLAMSLELAKRLEHTTPWFGLLMGDLILTVVEAVMLATGALLLTRRNNAGRWMIFAAGGTTALHGLSAIGQYLAMGGVPTLEGTMPKLVFIASPLTAVAAATAAVLAVLPSAGRWCHRSG
ncbi:serine/threonine-protein kinase [Nonomuraea fastidiosa]|uniref:serine/threonine-protein kinase n=1 Tax=Nonomuraea TaxID=83681 RepID=UPI0032547C71